MRYSLMLFMPVLFLGFAMISSATEKAISGDQLATDKGLLIIHPINHASFIMQWSGKIIYVDPVGGATPFTGLPKPDLVLITHEHYDHLDVKTLEAVLPVEGRTLFIAPQSVAEKIPADLQSRLAMKILANGENAEVQGIGIEAVAAYNTSPDKQKFHPKGRGNGYVLTIGGKRIYIAGDTEDTPEMRALKNIDIAFLPMNQPYTMSVTMAAEAIRQLKPKIVYPYHYRNQDGTKTDFEQLKRLVGATSEIRVRDWYAP